jgi:hypothetical protein
MCPSSSGNTLMAEDAAEPGDRKGPQLSLWPATLYRLFFSIDEPADAIMPFNKKSPGVRRIPGSHQTGRP